jgi:hypothetical protein
MLVFLYAVFLVFEWYLERLELSRAAGAAAGDARPAPCPGHLLEVEKTFSRIHLFVNECLDSQFSTCPISRAHPHAVTISSIQLWKSTVKADIPNGGSSNSSSSLLLSTP